MECVKRVSQQIVWNQNLREFTNLKFITTRNYNEIETCRECENASRIC